MDFTRTTPEKLAEEIIANLGKGVQYEQVPLDGAKKAAALIKQLF
jgi:hypothetical protein